MDGKNFGAGTGNNDENDASGSNGDKISGDNGADNGDKSSSKNEHLNICKHSQCFKNLESLIRKPENIDVHKKFDNRLWVGTIKFYPHSATYWMGVLDGIDPITTSVVIGAFSMIQDF